MKLSEILIVEEVEEVEGPYMHPNQRLIPMQKWYGPRDIQLTPGDLTLCPKSNVRK